MERSIAPFVYTKVVVLKENNTCFEAARAMCENRIGSVVVSDNKGHITGLLTDRDLVCGLLALNYDANMLIGEVMTPNVFFVGPLSTIDDVIAVMHTNGIRRVPVIEMAEGGRQHCIGMITLDDLIANQAIDPFDLAKIAKSQIVRKRKYLHRSAQHQGRSLQTMDKFIEAFRTGLELNEESSRRIIDFIFSEVVRRLHYSGAAHLISQLPQMLQDDLLQLPAGPDRSITAERLIVGLADRLGISEENARRYFPKFWRILNEKISSHEADHVIHQLPLDIQSLFLNERVP